ncbi:hypothetical protein C8R31_10199 [Nitrosospira sp. Nsp2]|nr:hypothetical protein C8R31_10199 [Nitrosospira sp. Nsp2]
MIKLVKILTPFLIASFSAYAESRITLSIDDVQSPFLNSKGVQVSLAGSRASVLEIKLGEMEVQGKSWRDLRFSCAKFQVTGSAGRCEKGVLRVSPAPPLPVAFLFSSADKTLDVQLQATTDAASGGWRLSARWGRAGWEGRLTAANGQLAQLQGLLPIAGGEILPSSTKGNINGKITLRGNADGVAEISANVAVNELAFSDASGLHAGENIGVEVNINAKRGYGPTRRLWEWQTGVNWLQGEVFWQPLYFVGRDYRFNASGDLYETILRLAKGNLFLKDIGEMDFSGVVDTSVTSLRDFDLRADNLELGGVFSQVLKPFLVNTPFAELKAEGRAGIQWQFRQGAHQSLNVNLHETSFEDGHGRFAFRGVNARVPWRAQGLTQTGISIRSSQLGKLPIGEFEVPLQIDGPNFSIARMVVPVLDGKLTLEDFNASPQTEGGLNGWQWQLSGGLSPISMEKLTEALATQSMKGTLSGTIPRVSYNGSAVEVDGALLFKVFDGTVKLGNLKVLDPLGPAPSFMADLDMRNLDLNQLTGTFSFGSMQGRIDATVNGLELFDWKPVKFDASIRSSAGNYPRRISQAAVQNISSLGGSGAAAAIQRSFLHFFDQFGYLEIGWSCSLRHGICHMGGIESEPLPHGYLIVKGGGIPAITVIGYNRNVDWDELVSRLQRITQARDIKPVFQ